MKHSYTRRAEWHDYYAPCYYHIVMYRLPEVEALTIVPEEPIGIRPHKLLRTKTGLAVQSAIASFRQSCKALMRITNYVIMPDHIHFILHVKTRLDRHAGQYIAYFSRIISETANTKVFYDNYTDKILLHIGQLNTWVRYIEDNPRRLQIKRLYPHLFTQCRQITIQDPQSRRIQTFTAFGNIFLLRYPARVQVRFSRGYTAQQLAHHRDTCRRAAEQGDVLVSPFIHPTEKEIRREGIESGGKIIHIYNESLHERFKPSGHDFDLCASGRLLILAPVGLSLSTPLSRDACMYMNNLAAYISTLPGDAHMSMGR